MLKTQIAQLVKGENLSREATAEAFDKIMSGEANDIQKTAFLTALAAKGETIDEITSAPMFSENTAQRFPIPVTLLR